MEHRDRGLSSQDKHTCVLVDEIQALLIHLEKITTLRGWLYNERLKMLPCSQHRQNAERPGQRRGAPPRHRQQAEGDTFV